MIYLAALPFLCLIAYGLYQALRVCIKDLSGKEDPCHALGYCHSVLVLLVRMGGAEGYNEVERSEIYSYLGLAYSKRAVNRMVKHFQQLRYKDVSSMDLDDVVRRIGDELSYYHRFLLFSTLYKVAASDRILEKDEVELIERYALLAKIRANDFLGIKQFYEEQIHGSGKAGNKANDEYRYREKGDRRNSQKSNESSMGSSHPDPNEWAYAKLGIHAEATKKEIKSAYRKLSMRYHSDHHMGESPSEQRRNMERLLEVQEAYHVLMKNYL